MANEASIRANIMAMMGGITEESKEIAPPIALDYDFRVSPKSGQLYTALAYLPVNPEQLIQVAINEPNLIREFKLPIGHVMHLGSFQDESEAEAYAETFLNDNVLHNAVIRPTGVWIPIVPGQVVKDENNKKLIDAKSRETMYAEKMKAMNKTTIDRKNAAQRMTKINEYDKQTDDPNHIMRYVSLIHKKNLQTRAFNEVYERLNDVVPVLKKTLSEFEDIEAKHPEFKQNWPAALAKFCEETNTINPYKDAVEDAISSINSSVLANQVNEMTQIVKSLTLNKD